MPPDPVTRACGAQNRDHVQAVVSVGDPRCRLVPRRLRAILASVVLGLTALTPAMAPAVAVTSAGAAVAVTTTGSLSVTPTSYVAGQAVRLRGRLGTTVRTVHLQLNMNRAGDSWVDVPDSTHSTDNGGNFDFWLRAPAMFKISYRVVAGTLATTSYLFSAHPQELTLAPVGKGSKYPFYPVRAGASVPVVVDTTPEIKTSFGSPPPIPGRTVLLQERMSGSVWRTLATDSTDTDGNAYFTVTAPASGARVLRAREEPVSTGMNGIGWFASFPAYFVVSGAHVNEPASTVYHTTWPTESGLRPTAAQRFGWGRVSYDYAWEGGQDLDSPPSKGDVVAGKWGAFSNGTGRVTPFNGGLVLQSKFKKVGPGDRGSTAATLDGAARAHGRWEFRLQGRLWETGARPYRFRLELVPAGAAVTDCSAESVVLADFSMGAPGMRFGVRSRNADAVWVKTLSDVRLAEQPFNVAVEVGNDHITWFRDGNPVGTVTDARAQLGVQLVPRLSLIGANAAEMNGAQVNSDWQRSWSLSAGQQVKNAAPLSRAPYSTC
jgi:hypothetical protein